MVDVTEDTIAQLQDIAEEVDKSIDEVKEEYKEKYNEVDERASGLPDDKVEEIALKQYTASVVTANRVPTDEIEMLTIGGDVRDTSSGDMFFGTAIVDEDPNDDSVPSKMGEVRIFDEGIAHQVYEAFDHVGNIVTGNFAVQEGDLQNHVAVSDSEDSEFEVTRPNDRSVLINEIRTHVPETNIADIADDTTAKSRGENGNMYNVSSDIRRIEATIYDGYKNPDSGTGIYTLRDDTVFDDEDVVESGVFNPDESNENATPGLTCFFDPNKMEWGSGSIIEFYGKVTKNDDGIIQMGADGAVEVFPEQGGYDGYTDSEDDEGGNSPERNTGSANVDRTNI